MIRLFFTSFNLFTANEEISDFVSSTWNQIDFQQRWESDKVLCHQLDRQKRNSDLIENDFKVSVQFDRTEQQMIVDYPKFNTRRLIQKCNENVGLSVVHCHNIRNDLRLLWRHRIVGSDHWIRSSLLCIETHSFFCESFPQGKLCVSRCFHLCRPV